MSARSGEKRSSDAESSPMFPTILVAVDASDNSRRASQVAVELARRFNSRLIILNVMIKRPPLPLPSYIAPSLPQKELDAYNQYLRREANAIVGEAVSLAKGRGVEVRPEVLEVSTSVVQGITNYAATEKVDLIAIGTRGLGGFKKMLIGSVSSGVVTHAPCPVLVVR